MWTPSEDERLQKLWPDHSASEIAAMLGRTRNAVIGRKHRIDRTYAGRVYNHVLRQREESAVKAKLRLARQTAAIEAMRRRIAGGMVRNKAIKRAVFDGATMRAVGEVFGITTQAISLIVRG